MSNNSFKIMLCDDRTGTLAETSAKLKSMGIFTVIRRSDENILINSVRKEKPDIVVADLTSSRADLLRLMKNSENLFDKRPKFIITSDIDNSFIKRQVMDAGAAYFLPEPYNSDELSFVIKSFVTNRHEPFLSDVEFAVTNAIHTLAVPANIKGYHYIRTAVIMSLKKQLMVENVTRTIYPAVAEYYHTTSSGVEKAIRHAIEISWNRVETDAVMSYFGSNFQVYRSHPTNSEYLAAVADKVKLTLKS